MRPIITLTTDYGLADAYVAEMKAAIFAHCPDANIVDVTHLIPPQDILTGSLALERAIRAFGAGTVHVGVIDPGVGTDRKIIRADIRGQTLLVPDNGLITWAYRRLGGEAVELVWRPQTQISNTFHGRDIFAPAAGMIAAGTLPADSFAPIDKIMLLDIAPAKTFDEVRIVSIDHFGNAVTNLPGDLVRAGLRVHQRIDIHSAYADVPRGQPLAIVGSSGLLEIAINGGHAAKKFKLRVGQRIRVE